MNVYISSFSDDPRQPVIFSSAQKAIMDIVKAFHETGGVVFECYVAGNLQQFSEMWAAISFLKSGNTVTVYDVSDETFVESITQISKHKVI